MTDKKHPIVVNPPVLTAWTPTEGVVDRLAGEQFDAVCLRGLLGLETALALHTAARPTGSTGPVVVEDRIGDELHIQVRFFVAPGTAAEREWPVGVTVLDHGQPVMVPAFSGNTWPVSWWSRPTESARLVDRDLLHAAVSGLVPPRRRRQVMAPNAVATPYGLGSATARDGDWYTVVTTSGRTLRMHRDRYLVARADGIVKYAELTGSYVVERYLDPVTTLYAPQTRTTGPVTPALPGRPPGPTAPDKNPPSPPKHPAPPGA